MSKNLPYNSRTLEISQKSVYIAYNTTFLKQTLLRQICEVNILNSKRNPRGGADLARDHIKSFPKIESHYGPANNNREYLESHRNVANMFDLNKAKCRCSVPNNSSSSTKRGLSAYEEALLVETLVGVSASSGLLAYISDLVCW